MQLTRWILRVERSGRLWLGWLLALGAVGCGREEIRVYRAPKEQPPSTAVRPMGASTAPTERLAWTLPPGWDEQAASGLRYGSFRVTGSGQAMADVSVVLLQGDAGGELANVNRWREQIGLPPVSGAELARQSTRIAAANQKVLLVDLAGEKPIGENKQRLRILAAILPRGSATWFFKMTGETKLVAAQKPKFIGFVQSVRFTTKGGAGALAETPPSTAAGGRPQWKAPPGWKEQPATAMRKGSFRITGDSNTEADVSITSLAGAAGGVAANVNRWRGQAGLPSLSETEVHATLQELAVDKRKVVVADLLAPQPAMGRSHRVRIIGAVMEHGNETWFVKMMGDDPLVAAQKTAFLDFLKTFQFP